MHQRYEVGLQTTESKIISRAAAKCLEALCGQSTLQEAMLIWSLIARWAPTLDSRLPCAMAGTQLATAIQFSRAERVSLDGYVCQECFDVFASLHMYVVFVDGRMRLLQLDQLLLVN